MKTKIISKFVIKNKPENDRDLPEAEGEVAPVLSDSFPIIPKYIPFNTYLGQELILPGVGCNLLD